ITVFAASSNCSTNTANDPCVQSSNALKPCGASIPKTSSATTSTEVFRVTRANITNCACNQAFYNTLTLCAACLTTNTLDVHVIDLPTYKNDCISFGASFVENAGGNNFVLIAVFAAITVIAVSVVAALVTCQFCRRRKRQNQEAASRMNDTLVPESHYSGANIPPGHYPHSNVGYDTPSSAPPPQYST
ncbi:8988_t:CDS:2, partial [Scutellospora calospora]